MVVVSRVLSSSLSNRLHVSCHKSSVGVGVYIRWTAICRRCR